MTVSVDLGLLLVHSDLPVARVLSGGDPVSGADIRVEFPVSGIPGVLVFSWWKFDVDRDSLWRPSVWRTVQKIL